MVFGKYINRYYLRYLHYILGGILALLLVDFFQLEIPELYRMVINGANEGTVTLDGVVYAFDMNFLLDKICLPLVGIILLIVLGRFLWRICLFGAGIKVETDLRKRMFDRCKDLSQHYYHLNKVGTLMSLFTNDIETVQDCFGSGILMFCDALLLGVLALTKMFRMNTTMTLLSMIPMAFLLAVGTVVGKKMMDKWEKRQESFSALSDFSQESFSGIAVVKAFVKELSELLSFKKLNKQNEETNVSFTKTSVALHILVTLFVESVICIILGYGGYLVYKGTFNAGELLEFISYFTSIIWPIMAVSQLIDMQSRGKASLNRISELLSAKPEITDRKGAVPATDVKGSIRFDNLTFRYPDADYDALKEVSFCIEAGESVGIIGKTGAGKTTVVDLILRTYNVPDGTLFIDGKDVNGLTVQSVRQSCAYVPQDNFLFSDTIASNISFAMEETDLAEVERAATLADVADNIAEFPEGYKTVLGERGVTVSGGQKQRISIARALLKNAPILILDDSVSAVDVNTEKTILKNLRETRKGKTTILIAHRISTVESMDKIILLEDGRVAAFGRHEELLQTSEAYLSMVRLQQLEDEQGGNE